MNDLISRQAAIDALLGITPMQNTIPLASAIFSIKKLPSAQPERKNGEWELNKDGNWACPFCEFDPYHDNMKGMNYCPNCGAKLEQESRL